MEKKTYGKPALVVEQFVANGYICACYSVACLQPSYVGNNSSPGDQNTTYWLEAAYGTDCHYHSGSCKASSNNYITTDDNGVITGGYEDNSEQGKLTIGANGYYDDNNGNGKCDAGDTVYWTTYGKDGNGNNRCWNHYGTADVADSKHPNAS